jgi:RNA polymerase sigma factor (sigma-70 family)
MTERDDHELLSCYARDGSEAAFATLVERHVNLVYSTAHRFTGNSHHAEEITQAVFMILARKARSVRSSVVLSGWLYQTARFTAANFVKGEIRRQRREQEAYMQSQLNEPNAAWEQILPLLDDAMGRLRNADRDAIVLRFFENKTAAQAAAVLQTTEAAAHKRVNRALQKLRSIFRKRGAVLSVSLIAVAITANSVQAAPAPLTATITGAAVGNTSVSSSSALLLKSTLQRLLWLKLRAAGFVALGLSLLAMAAIARPPRQPPQKTLPVRSIAFPPDRAPAVRLLASAALIKIRLHGTPGLPFMVVFSTDGRSQTNQGVLPDEVLFNADAFSAAVAVQGPGEFGLDLYRDNLRMSEMQTARIAESKELIIEGRKGGAGISIRNLPKGGGL